MAKASLDRLNTLHDKVTQELSNGLDDPKILMAAIKFLKDNDITADLVTDDSETSLGSAIKQHLKMPTVEKLTVEAMLEMAV